MAVSLPPFVYIQMQQQKIIKGPSTVAGIHSSGKGIVCHEDKNVFIEGIIPGEEILFVSGRRNMGFRTGAVEEILNPSPNRVSPFCKHHNDCSGCNWQHISYEHQLHLKHSILINALEKYGIKTPPVPSVVPSPTLQFYRHRVEYSFSDKPALGFHKTGDPDQIYDIRECFLQQEPSRSICTWILDFAIRKNIPLYNTETKTGVLRSLSIRTGTTENMVVIGFASDEPDIRERICTELLRNFPNVNSICWTIHESPRHSQQQGVMHAFSNTAPYVHEKVSEITFRVHASSFFQPNVAQAGSILNTITEWAQLKGDEKIFDLYTGVGTIALFLAKQGAASVLGIEGNAQAIEDATFNAKMNQIENARFMTGDILETFNSAFLEKQGHPDIIVLDPPRSGTLIEIKKTINASRAKKVIYLSCNPVSLAFDLKQLTEIYHVKRIQPFDMLPHTHHLETLVLLER